jgi:two-component system response regulator (stage 0 sporulation protein F)
MKILIVDDETDVTDLFRQQFRREIKQGKIEILFAHSGAEALELLESADVADIILILSDINMPGMTGFDLLESVKKKFPYLKVIMVSAYGDAANQDKARSIGADGFVPKPVDFDALKEQLFRHTHEA